MRGRRFIALLIVVAAGFAAVVSLQPKPAAPPDAPPVSPPEVAGASGVPLEAR